MKIDDVFKNNNVFCAHYISNYRDRAGSDHESYLYLCRDFPPPLVQDACRSDLPGKKKARLAGLISKNFIKLMSNA